MPIKTYLKVITFFETNYWDIGEKLKKYWGFLGTSKNFSQTPINYIYMLIDLNCVQFSEV